MTETLLDIQQIITINADQATVWKVLTEPGYVNQWLGCMRYEKALGHVFYMQQDQQKREAGDIEGATHCRILSMDEPAEFIFSWYFPDTPETTVRITLQTVGNNTEVTLSHSGWNQFDIDMIKAIRDGLEGGWKSFVLPQLKQVAENVA